MMTEEERKERRSTYCREYQRKKRAENPTLYKEYYENNRERILARNKLYRLAHRERYAELYRAWYEKNRQRISEKLQQARLENPEKYRDRERAWKSANRDKVNQWRYNNDRARLRDLERRRQHTIKETAAVALLRSFGIWEPGPHATLNARRAAALAYIRQAGLLPPR